MINLLETKLLTDLQEIIELLLQITTIYKKSTEYIIENCLKFKINKIYIIYQLQFRITNN